ncbi:MAG TPA: hypothetical protein VJB16_06265 [archaeon]|nr:hypothetical protein [archaeon]
MVFEQVLLFAVGIVIFLACFAVFSIAQGYYTDAAARDQMGQVRELIAGEVQALAAGGNSSNGSAELAVPREIQGEVYQIVLGPEGLNVSSAFLGISSASNLGRANESFNLSGALTSNSGRVTVEKTEGRIRVV